MVGLLGPNGAGKTTTFLYDCRLKKPTQGKVFDDLEITIILCIKRSTGINYLPQEASIFRKLSVKKIF